MTVIARQMTIYDLAQGIATAEGFYEAGAFPERNNNPGDLVVVPGYEYPGQVGADQGKAIFANEASGWGALFHQLRLIFTYQSSNYRPEWTFQQLAQVWTGGDNADTWAVNVASYVGATSDMILNKVVTLL